MQVATNLAELSNFRFIYLDYDILPILNQVHSRSQDWQLVSTMKNIGGDTNPYGFLPLTMAVTLPGMDPKNTELQLNTPIYDEYTEVHKFFKKHQCENHSRAAFFRLKPGDGVGRHIDEGSYYLTRDRYHLCLQGQYEYRVGDQVATITPGMFFWFNNKIEHESLSTGDVDRISLVFDVPHSKYNP